MRKFSDALSKEVYRSVYNRSKAVKNPWWVCITEGEYVDGEFVVKPVFLLSEESNILSANLTMVSLGMSLNALIENTLHPTEFEWEKNDSGMLEEVYIHMGIVHLSRKGEIVLWELVEPEEILKTL